MTVAFLLELCMLFSLGYYGFNCGADKIWRLILMISLPLIAIVLWGYFAAPRSANRLPIPYRILFELSLYFITSFLLYKAGSHNYAFILAGTAVLSELLAWSLNQ
jgi:hypothetical protein